MADRLLGPVDHQHFRELKAGPVIGIDGTGLDVVAPGLGEVWHGYLDVFCHDHLHVYQYNPTKHARLLNEKPGDYAGVVVCDAESRNDFLFGPCVVEVNCNAHPRSKFKDAERRQLVLARVGKSFLDRMYAVEDRACERGLLGPELLALRQREARPVFAKFRARLDRQAAALLSSDPLGKGVRDYPDHWDALTLFVGNAAVPIDNNRSERAFQVLVKPRVSSEFAGSTGGAHRWATLLGIVNTAKRLDVDILAYLTWAIERLGTWKKVFDLPASALTPAAYKQAMAARVAA